MTGQTEYIPRRGDVVRILLNPQIWYDQSGLKPAVVLSPASYNGKVGLALFCPVSLQAKGYPFEVALPEGFPVAGVILADRVKSLDWRSRQTEFIGSLPPSVFGELLGKFQALL